MFDEIILSDNEFIELYRQLDEHGKYFLKTLIKAFKDYPDKFTDLIPPPNLTHKEIMGKFTNRLYELNCFN